jgi:molybdopterin molybdotransferase
MKAEKFNKCSPVDGTNHRDLSPEAARTAPAGFPVESDRAHAGALVIGSRSIGDGTREGQDRDFGLTGGMNREHGELGPFDAGPRYGEESAMPHYNDALRQILDHIPVMEAESKSFPRCVGQICSENIHADFDLPLSGISVPDGYAVISDDIEGASEENPVCLKVAGTVRAGHGPAKELKPGSAIRIMTGSIIPKGADCVVRFEDTDEPVCKTGRNGSAPEVVRIYKEATPGENIRSAGSNIRKGELLMSVGTIIGPTQMSVLLSAGKKRVRVIRRPVLALIATGDELVNPGRPLSPGMAYNSNMASLSALTRYYGGIPKVMGIARDNEASLMSKLKNCMNADAVVTSGGVSTGDYDLVKVAIEKLGKVVFSNIDMGNGVAAFGLIRKNRAESRDEIPVFSLSGQPSGCLINFIALVRRALLKMRGLTDTSHPVVEAVCADGIVSRTPRSFTKWTSLKKENGRFRVTLNLADNPMDFTYIAEANSIAVIPGNTTVRAGDTIDVLPLEWCW